MFNKYRISFFATAFMFAIYTKAQTSVFDFLDLPVSSHTAALGGRNVSINDAEPALLHNNPALLANIPERLLAFNFMSFISASKLTGVQFCDLVKDRSTYAISIIYTDYGSFNRRLSDNTEAGIFSAKDIALGGSFSYLFNNYWSGGVTGRIIYSKYSYYTSVAIGVDMGLNYYNPINQLSFGIAASNLGGQIKAFNFTRESLPLNVTTGVSWKLQHSPVRFSITLENLNNWRSDNFYSSDGIELKFGEILMRHFILGADIYLSEQLYVAAGYNYRRQAEFSVKESRGLEGFSIGTGLTLKKIIFGISFGKYQVSKSSLLFNFAVSI